MTNLSAVTRPLLRYHNRRVSAFNVSWAAVVGFHSNLQLLAPRPSRPKTTTATEKQPLPPTAEIKKPEGPLDRSDATTEDEGPTHQVESTARQIEPDAGQQEPTEAWGQGLQAKLGKRSENPPVMVLWDLDNQSPGAHPAEAAESIRNLASKYGEVTAIHAYANRHAFIQINAIQPPKRKTNPDLQVLEPWEAWEGMPEEWDGDLLDEEPEELRCGVCGQKQKTTKKLLKHMKSLHVRERTKKLNHIAQTKSGKKKEKLWKRYEPYLEKYALKSARMSNPESMGIKEDLRKAGVEVNLVSHAPEAADGAIRRQFKKALQNRVGWVFLVSDDKGFEPTLDLAKKKGIKTFVVGTKESALRRSATSFMSWHEVREKF